MEVTDVVEHQRQEPPPPPIPQLAAAAADSQPQRTDDRQQQSCVHTNVKKRRIDIDNQRLDDTSHDHGTITSTTVTSAESSSSTCIRSLPLASRDYIRQPPVSLNHRSPLSSINIISSYLYLSFIDHSIPIYISVYPSMLLSIHRISLN